MYTYTLYPILVVSFSEYNFLSNNSYWISYLDYVIYPTMFAVNPPKFDRPTAPKIYVRHDTALLYYKHRFKQSDIIYIYITIKKITEDDLLWLEVYQKYR